MQSFDELGPQITDISMELERGPTPYATREPGTIQRIVIHHTATPASTTPQAIARYHVRERGWPGIGYHYVIAADGTVYQTNPPTSVSYHVRAFNPESIGIALVGDFTAEPPPATQLRAAAELIRSIRSLLGRELPVFGHRDLNATQCPGNTWHEWRVTVTAMIEGGAGWRSLA